MSDTETDAASRREAPAEEPEPRSELLEAPEGSPTLEGLFETALWYSRFVMVVPVILGILMAAGALYTASVDAVYLLGLVSRYADAALTEEMRLALRTEIVASIVKVVGIYLIGATLIVFSLGLYQLFVKRLEEVERSETAGRLLRIESLDELKDRLAKLIVLALIVELFHYALRQSYERPLDLLYLSGGILLVGLAVFFTAHRGRG